MGQPANIANVPEILKNIWDDEIFDFMYEDSPFFAQIDKDTTWDGLAQIITVQYAGMSGRANTFADAQNDKGPPKYAQMNILTRDNFAIWSVDHKLITLSRNQRGALVRALAENTEKAFEKLKRSTCWQIWRNGGGAIGKISAIDVTGKIITLVDPNDVRNFDDGDYLQDSTDDGAAAAPAGVNADVTYVTNVDEDAGTITVNDDVLTFATPWAVGDFLFPKGDYGKAFTGVASYVPLDKPGTGGVPLDIWGMDRSKHYTRLGGNRFTATTADVIAEIKLALTKAHRRNAKIDQLYTGPEAWDEVDSALQGQKRYVDVEVGRVGFKGIEFSMQSGKIVQLLSDADIPKSAAGKRLVYGFNMKTWKFHSALSYPMWMTRDGKQDFMQEQNANQSEGRIGGYAEPYTKAPGQNFVLELTT